MSAQANLLPKVSVIVTAYNQDNTIRQTLDSILMQICSFPYEIIIGNDCSTDHTAVVCEQYAEKYPQLIRVLNHEKNVGVATNWIRCIQTARGEYIAACAADDFWHDSQKMQLQAEYLDGHITCGLVYTDYDLLNGTSGRIKKAVMQKKKEAVVAGANTTKAIFAGKADILLHTVMFRKSVFDKHVPANDFCNLFTIEDWPTWIILSKYSDVGYIPLSTATYRVGHESSSNIQKLCVAENRFRREEKMYKYLCELFPDDAVYEEAVYKSYVDSVMMSISFKNRNYQVAKTMARKLEANGIRNLRTLVAQNQLLFLTFCYAKKVKQLFG